MRGSTPIWCNRVFRTNWLTVLSSAASTRSVEQAQASISWASTLGGVGNAALAPTQVSGKVARNVVPAPTSLLASIAPPIRPASSRQMARPRPVPP